jgi:hypothetical protein
MGSVDVEEALTAAESAVADGRGLAGTGFWQAVHEVKAHPELVERYASRIARIDRAAFKDWAFFTIGVTPGTIIVTIGVLIGVVLVGLAYSLTGFAAVVVFYAGLGALLVTTHGMAHLVVGGAVGIEFTDWFIGTIARPQPGVKVDYESYLRAAAGSRAWMHASGAIVTKVLPFVMIGSAIAADLPAWAVWLLPVVGIMTIVTDTLWSTKASDWKKYSREMSYAREI